jgi:murein DD-endopeptidase / murein LD-carboxypeptidase
MPERIEVPKRFLAISYNGDHYPGAPGVNGLIEGANCQLYAYEILRHFGLQIPDFRSSNLWEDTQYTDIVSDLGPLDIVLFNRTKKVWGAHVGLCISSDEIIHLSKQVGRPAIWGMAEFQMRPEYQTFIGAKRIRAQASYRSCVIGGFSLDVVTSFARSKRRAMV